MGLTGFAVSTACGAAGFCGAFLSPNIYASLVRLWTPAPASAIAQCEWTARISPLGLRKSTLSGATHYVGCGGARRPRLSVRSRSDNRKRERGACPSRRWVQLDTGSIIVINRANNTIQARIPMPTEPAHLAAQPGLAWGTGTPGPHTAPRRIALRGRE